jgi:hypothetical protein
MTDISLLLPTRARPALVNRLFESVVQTTTLPDNLECVVYIDVDDDASCGIERPAFKVSKLMGPAGQTMGNMMRSCYEASRGRYVMLLNDDVVFRTPGWDDRVRLAFQQFPDEVALVYGNDLDQGQSRPTLPFVSRTVCQLMGAICPRGYHNLHIESHLFDIFKQLSDFDQHRLVYLGDVVFEHMHYTVGKAHLDSTYVKKHKQNDDVLFISLDTERHNLAARMERFISTSRPSSTIGLVKARQG